MKSYENEINNRGKLEGMDLPEQVFDVQKIADIFKENFRYFILLLFLFLFSSFLYLRYATPKYKIHAKVLVQDEKKNSNPTSLLGPGLIKDFGDLFGVKNNVANEVEILETNTLLYNIVKKNKYYIQYFRTGIVNDIELFNDIPFEVDYLSEIDSIKVASYNVLFSDDFSSFSLTTENDPVSRKYTFGQRINTAKGDFLLKKKSGNYMQKAYSFVIRNIDQTVGEISSNLNIDITNKETSVIGIEYISAIPAKGENLLESLIGAYMDRNLNEKNRIIDSTLEFLSGRIGIVVNDLNAIEGDFQNFKKANKLIDIPNQSKALIENVNNYYNKTKEAEVQLSVINNMISIIESNEKKIIPYISNNRPSFLALLNSYNTLIIEREKLLLTAKEGNPFLVNIDQQLSNVKADMIKDLKSQQKDLSISQSKFEDENNKINAQISALPSTERTYVNFSREREVKQALYLFLLQQKEQAAISKASNISNATVIDGPKSEFRPFTPNKTIIYFLGVILAFIVTLFIFFIKRLFNNKINSKRDLLKLSDCPILGEIGHSSHDGIVIDEDGRSVISEQFRQLRTNLSFVLGSNKCSKIVITSSISGEGKSFISFNLALIYARAQKRVLLVEMDLRKPKLSKLLNIDNSRGFTTFTVNNGDINDYIHKLPQNENLHFLCSGPIPPNPAELLMSDSTTKMFDTLSGIYDLIVIDTPPLGLVTDAQIISNYSDTILYLTRCNFSWLKSIEIINDYYNQKKLKNLYLLLNDVKNQDGSYGYGYGYGYGYDEGSKKKSFFRKLFNRK